MSELKVNKISPQSGTAFTIGDSGDTFTVPSGATLTVAGTFTQTGAQTFDGGVDIDNFNINGTTIALSSGNMTIDAQGNDTDIIFKGTDGGADTTFLTIDGSAAGAATFNDKIIATELDISGNCDIDGTTNLDAVDIDGAVQLDATLTIGANDQGYDVILYGDTASANVTWDTSADDLIFNGAAGLIVPDGQLTLGSTAVTATAAELNLIDGGTSRGTTAIADGDGVLINDAGTMRMTTVQTLKTYVDTSGHVLISSVTISGTGAYSINDCFSSTYRDYRIIGSGLDMATDNTKWVFYLKNSGGNTTDQYYWAGVGQRDAGSAVDDGENNVSDFAIISNASNDNNGSTNFDMVVYRPQLAYYTAYTCHAGGRRNSGNGHTLSSSGYQNSNTQHTGIVFNVDNGNMSSGTIKIFGIKDS